MLRDRKRPKEERAEAVKFLIHFVQDVHQPLHVSYQDDRGGNSVKVTWMGEQTNFHYVWDNSIIEQRVGREDWIAYAKTVQGGITDAQLKTLRESTNAADWANESLTITRRLYLDLPKDGVLDNKYYERNIGTVEDRLAAAGVRLAMLLNEIFSDQAGTTQPTTTEPSTQPAASEPATAPLTEDAASHLHIVLSGSCGNAGGQAAYLVNDHASKTIRAKVQRAWSSNGKDETADTSVTIRPGETGKKQLGCSAQRIHSGETRSFKWTIVEAEFLNP